MKKENDPAGEASQPSGTSNENARPWSGAFNEPPADAQKSTVNNEEADLEQDRKEAMTERD